MENWESAVGWQEEAWGFQFNPEIANTVHLITGLYLLEGMIIYLAYKMDRKHLLAVTRATKRINELFSILEKFEKNFRIILPRLAIRKLGLVVVGKRFRSNSLRTIRIRPQNWF